MQVTVVKGINSQIRDKFSEKYSQVASITIHLVRALKKTHVDISYSLSCL